MMQKRVLYLTFLITLLIVTHFGFSLGYSGAKHIQAVKALEPSLPLVVMLSESGTTYGSLQPELLTNQTVVQVSTWQMVEEVLFERHIDAFIVDAMHVENAGGFGNFWLQWAYRNGVVLVFIGIQHHEIPQVVDAPISSLVYTHPAEETPCVMVSSLLLAENAEDFDYLERIDWRQIAAEGQDLSDYLSGITGYTRQSMSAGICDLSTDIGGQLLFTNINHQIEGIKNLRYLLKVED